MWIARTGTGRLFLFKNRPHKHKIFGWATASDDVIELDKYTFPEITSDMSEPTEVTIAIK